MSGMETKDIGLRGIPVADSAICLIKGTEGELYYRGFDIYDLITHSNYEEVAYLLLYDNLPTDQQYKNFTNFIASNRELPQEVIEYLQSVPHTMAPMDVVQSTVSILSGFDPELEDRSRDAACRRATRLIAKVPTAIAMLNCIRKDIPPKRPDKNLSQAANILYLLTDHKPDQETAREFDIALILHAEHSFNASTFAARVVASTRAHMYASIAAAVGALSGELHGGANTRVMQTLMKIGDLGKVENWVKTQFDQGKRIMGMGHAVYKTMDPRAQILKRMGASLARRTEEKWFVMTKKIEETTKKEFKQRKGGEINPNVDLYSASFYYMLGIPPELYTPIFAASRIAGWAAHVLEEKFPKPPIKPMLYRPAADYIGNYCGLLGCKYIPLEKRKDQSEQ